MELLIKPLTDIVMLVVVIALIKFVIKEDKK